MTNYSYQVIQLVPLSKSDFVGAAFCLAALKGESWLPHIKNNHLRWTSTGKQALHIHHATGDVRLSLGEANALPTSFTYTGLDFFGLLCVRLIKVLWKYTLAE